MIEEINLKNIEKLLNKYKYKTINLEELYKIVARVLNTKENKLKTTDYDIFYLLIKELENSQVLTKRGNDNNNRMIKCLYLKYNINKTEVNESILEHGDKIFLFSLNSNIDTSFYFKNPKEVARDREDLSILSSFLNEINKDTPYISVNERSYELFGYEKRLQGSKFEPSLLGRTKVGIESINCFNSYTPIQCYILPAFYKKKKRVILIVENLDTYWSFHRALNETSLYKKLDMLVYGGGNKTTGNFKFHRHYGITEKDTIYYFGDIDPEGFNIYSRVKKANESLNIKLAKGLYSYAIEIAEKKNIKDIYNGNQTAISEWQLDNILSEFNADIKIKIKEIIFCGKYIPQEAINYRLLSENDKRIKLGD